MKEYYCLMLLCILIFSGCSKIMNTSFWGLRLDKHYTPEEIITTIGTSGDYINIVEKEYSNDINYKNLEYNGFSWDYGTVSITSGTAWKSSWRTKYDEVLFEVYLEEDFDNRVDARQLLYSIKSRLDKKYKAPRTRIDGETETFFYFDTEDAYGFHDACIHLVLDKLDKVVKVDKGKVSYFVSLIYFDDMPYSFIRHNTHKD